MWKCFEQGRQFKKAKTIQICPHQPTLSSVCKVSTLKEENKSAPKKLEIKKPKLPDASEACEAPVKYKASSAPFVD